MTPHRTTVFLLDNVDSFTYNLVDELRSMALDIVVYRNTVSAWTLLDKMREKALTGPVLLMLSPGPGAPSEAGCMPDVLQAVAGVYPVLGICLGHQAIVEHYGGTVGRANAVMHGKASPIQHDGSAIFNGLPQPLQVARYHSLVATSMTDALTCIATTGDLVMAVLHEEDRMLGYQFHPESILTAQGSQLLKNSIDYLTQERTRHV